MEYKVIVHDEVKESLKNIFRYIYNETLNEGIATKVYENIYSAINWLDFLPHIYQISYKKYRVRDIYNYKIFYKIDENLKEVHIYKVLNSAQDFSKTL